jgi:hypothetical protein
MEIKITCGCGQKYIFSVDPEDGQMPVSVNCPACGSDGTEEANEILAQMFPPLPVEPAAEAAALPPAPAAGGPLRINLATSPVAAVPPLVTSAATRAPLKAPAPKPGLTWYEHVWTALPLGLVAVGGCIGGGIGGAAWAVNRQVFPRLQQPVLRYVVTGLISAAAVVIWLVVVSVVLGLIRK